MSEFDHDVLIVANGVPIDNSILDMWLKGCSVVQSCRLLIEKGALQEMEGADEDCVLFDVNDHYRLFSILEKHVENPRRMRDLSHLQLNAEACDSFIEKYYSFDDVVLREFVGKKFSGKTRRELDEVSDKTKVLLKSCRRQFDNFRRILKTVEDSRLSLIENIINHFCISEHLAKKYASAVFITSNKFETSKKRLNFVTFLDFVICSEAMMQYWRPATRSEDSYVDLDKDFMENLKELRTLHEKEYADEIKFNVIDQKVLRDAGYSNSDPETNFKSLFKILINIATELNHTSDLRDIFVDLVDRFVEPCKSLKWSPDQVSWYFNHLNQCVKDCDSLHKAHPQIWKIWDRYVRVVSVCILRLYHA